MKTIDQIPTVSRPLVIWTGLIMALGLPCLPISKWVNEFADVAHLVLYEVIWWSFVFALLTYVKKIEHRGFDSIGFCKMHVRDLLIALAATMVITAGLAAIYFYVLPAIDMSEPENFDQLLATPFWWRAISVIRAGVSEEIMFRGYSIERAEELTGNKFLASVISLVVFTFAHVPLWGWGHLLIAGFGGLLFTSLYLWKRNIWINIIAHTLVDAAAVLS